MIEQITFSASRSSVASGEYRILGDGYLLRASVVSSGPPELISNLTLVAFPELNGLNVVCNSESTGREVGVLHIACKLFGIDFDSCQSLCDRHPQRSLLCYY